MAAFKKRQTALHLASSHFKFVCAALENVPSSVQTTIGKYMKANFYSESTCRP